MWRVGRRRQETREEGGAMRRGEQGQGQRPVRSVLEAEDCVQGDESYCPSCDNQGQYVGSDQEPGSGQLQPSSPSLLGMSGQGIFIIYDNYCKEFG